MSDQQVIYSSVKVLQSPSDSQNHRLNLESTRRPGKTDHKECSVSWHLIAVILGIFCVLLLMTVTVLGIKVLQYIQEEHRWEETQQNISLKYDILKNETLHEKEKWNTRFTENNICHRKKSSSKSLQNIGIPSDGNWSCCGISCYYFTTEKRNWDNCKQICKMYNSSLLKIDDDDEKAFIQYQAHPDYYWIGLSYNDQERQWKWTDTDLSSRCSSRKLNLTSSKGKCAALTSTRIDNFECSNNYNCICEMMMSSLFK